ncbi:galactose mutarotase-like protein [Acaromyces ingoldii]|uniref:Galactose mutarotase-like protein n=1 Tax=Acaromyces ingoldii TaxID=215250 RepID=A0A316YXY5_9BASI|nr:galactose mutarotase-like protein [Acaromyces ingoldii]PWN93614.1 galactose mutarotase-like protein [Acaromyces ingoldii]
MLARSFTSLAALALAGLSLAQSSDSSSSALSSSSATSATASQPASTDSSSATTTGSTAQETPGFVNNGTVGAYSCAFSEPQQANVTAPVNQLVFLADAPNVTATDGSDSSNISSPARLAPTTLAECAEAWPPVYPYNAIQLRAPDDSIRAVYLPYGASVSELWVKDRNGVFRDVVLGFDNKTNYGTDKIHPNFGPQVGRYANRIKNGTFEINGTTYHTPLNENNYDTLHGGTVGYDRSPYEITQLNASSVTFVLHDADGNQGFPGSVVASASYTLQNSSTLIQAMDANVTDDKYSPIMLSSHTYWNLAAYNESQTILNHTLFMPRADKYIKTDGHLIPTGPIPDTKGTPLDFTQARTIGSQYNDTEGVCGTNCTGYDTCFVMSSHDRNETVLELTSPESGIKMSVKTDQDAIQIYSCPGVSAPATKGSLPRKRVHGGDGTLDEIYDNNSCVVVEMEDYIDGINNPAWNRSQIYSKDRPYHWRAEYSFSTVE